jgi:hypothetical protein
MKQNQPENFAPEKIIPLFHACFERINAVERKKKIDKLLTSFSWHEHYKDKITGRRVLSEAKLIEYPHELTTAKFLTQSNFDVIFAPKAMFKPVERKFDVFLIRDTIILKADLKFISSKNTDTIAKRIKYGSDQASRVVIHINSDINKKELINALRSGVERNNLIKEVLLFYRGKFYRLRKLQILSKAILKLI